MKSEWIKLSNAVLAVRAGSVAEQNCSQKAEGKVKCLAESENKSVVKILF